MSAPPAGEKWIEPALALFRAAIELPEEERAPFLERACGEDAALRVHVDRMLAADAAHGATLDEVPNIVHDRLVAVYEVAESERESTKPLPETIGGFRIVRRIAEGGMGIVYEAQQQHPERRVAIKVARASATTGERARRFELEAQLLARLTHPGIAQIIAAGTTRAEDGARPYFVMEYVAGRSLTDYAKAHLDTAREKVELMVRVCAAVGFAHESGVIHRDLKPDNVLIEDNGAPKVLDFGVAKVAAAAGFGAATLQTQAGRVLGTLGYMAPEQLAGRTASLGPQADVYSLGVMTYELLCGRLPHELDAVTWTEALAVVTTTEAPRLGVVRPEHRGDLDAVVAKALEKDARDRYANATALRSDLERFLRDEPVRARRHSAWHRARKFSRRHRGLVAGVLATIAALLLGLVASLGSLDVLERKTREFDQLAVNVLYARAVTRAGTLYPPWPDKLDAIERWLHEDCVRLLAMRPDLERTVAALRARALDRTDAELLQDRGADPRFPWWQRLGKQLESLRRAEAIRTGTTELVVPDVTGWQRALPVDALLSLAVQRTWLTADQRAVYGEEALGLALARIAAQKAKGTPRETLALQRLAWALFANGQDDEAKAQVRRALAAASAEHKAALETTLARLAEVAASLPAAEAYYAQATAAISVRKTWTFPADEQASQFLHDALAPALQSLARLEAHDKPLVEQLRRWARAVGELSRHHPNARVSWADARAAIAKADGIVASERYAGKQIELRDEDVLGLVPIGMNPTTKLWEFYELRSAWDGNADPASIRIPEHRNGGTIEVTEATGVVLVLLPGGTFVMGAQSDDARQPNYDPQAMVDELPHEVTLAPFFMSRHELTQAQWARLCTWEPTLREPSSRGGAEHRTHPVESVGWQISHQLVTRYGMTLPTEAQWEYACRAGTSTPWWPGNRPSDLEGCANVQDQRGAEARPGPHEPFNDGYWDHAPVGSFAANGFGLHDMHGNVDEWCQDRAGFSGTERPGDGLRTVGSEHDLRGVRGGSCCDDARRQRAALRSTAKEHQKHYASGLRCARPLVRAEAPQ